MNLPPSPLPKSMHILSCRFGASSKFLGLIVFWCYFTASGQISMKSVNIWGPCEIAPPSPIHAHSKPPLRGKFKILGLIVFWCYFPASCQISMKSVYIWGQYEIAPPPPPIHAHSKPTLRWNLKNNENSSFLKNLPTFSFSMKGFMCL